MEALDNNNAALDHRNAGCAMSSELPEMQRRIGGNMDPALIRRVRNDVDNGTLLPFYTELAAEHSRKLAVHGRHASIAAHIVQDRDNIARIARTMNRAPPAAQPGDEQYFESVVAAYAIGDIGITHDRQLLPDGWRGRQFSEEIVVLLPLEAWHPGNGFFADGRIEPGQDVCLEGAEAIILPGKGPCTVVMISLKLPRRI
ncbi:hypothetical protein LTR95_005991 [Oleoguttula sp. CCFEE 5521]